jgi:hypothetical protein
LYPNWAILADTFGYFFYQFLADLACFLGEEYVGQFFALDGTHLPNRFVKF